MSRFPLQFSDVQKFVGSPQNAGWFMPSAVFLTYIQADIPDCIVHKSTYNLRLQRIANTTHYTSMHFWHIFDSICLIEDITIKVKVKMT